MEEAMKPIYANTFNISHNKNRSEVALSFSHIYTEHSFSSKNGALTDVSAQVCDEVAGVLVSKDGAVALAKLLNRMLKDWGIDVTEE
jgi:hypothetical protein